MVAHTLRRQRLALSLTTRFCLPHEGMTQLEYLSRGSAFLLDTASSSSSSSSSTASSLSPPSSPSSPSRLRDIKVLTCQHVACPWLFPNYFAEKWDWLQHVSEEFVHHSLQLLELPAEESESHANPDSDADADTKQAIAGPPRVLVDIPLVKQVWLHPERDVAMLAIGEQDESRWQQLVAQWRLQTLTLHPTSAKPGDLLLFSGHKQIEENDDEDDAQATTKNFDEDDDNDDARSEASTTSNSSDLTDSQSPSVATVGQFPKEVYGRFVGQSVRGQAFAWSEEILEEGMCGGAVVNEAGACVGLVEGIVPPYDPKAAAAAAHQLNQSSADGSPSSHQDRQALAATARMQKALENHVAFVPSVEMAAFIKHPDQSLLTGMALHF